MRGLDCRPKNQQEAASVLKTIAHVSPSAPAPPLERVGDMPWSMLRDFADITTHGMLQIRFAIRILDEAGEDLDDTAKVLGRVRGDFDPVPKHFHCHFCFRYQRV